MAKKAPSYGKDQTARYNQHNPEDTIRGGMKTPVYGSGKITHSKPENPEPGSPPNTMGHLHVNSSKRKGR